MEKCHTASAKTLFTKHLTPSSINSRRFCFIVLLSMLIMICIINVEVSVWHTGI